jgi:hypothetical protein
VKLSRREALLKGRAAQLQGVRLALGRGGPDEIGCSNSRSGVKK